MNSPEVNAIETEPKWDWWKAIEAERTGRVRMEPHRHVPDGMPFVVQAWPSLDYLPHTDDEGNFHKGREVRAVWWFENIDPPMLLVSLKFNATQAEWDETIAIALRVWACAQTGKFPDGKCPVCRKELSANTWERNEHLQTCYKRLKLESAKEFRDDENAWDIGTAGLLRRRLDALKSAAKPARKTSARKGSRRGRKAVRS